MPAMPPTCRMGAAARGGTDRSDPSRSVAEAAALEAAVRADATIAAMARALMPDGEFRFVSDIDDYCAWTLAHLSRSPDFAWTAERASDWRLPWSDYTMTRYGRKAEREGVMRRICDFANWAEAALLLCVRPHPRLADIGRFNESKRRQNTIAIGRRPTAGVRPQTCCRRRHRGGLDAGLEQSTIGQIIAPRNICKGAARASIFALSSLTPIAGSGATSSKTFSSTTATGRSSR